MQSTIDLDNNATTPVLPEVAEAVLEAMAPQIGNPSSGHRHGHAARQLVEQARESVAAMLGTEPDRIVFTSGATEGNDAVLRSQFGRALHSVQGSHPSLVGDRGRSATAIPIDRSGCIDLDALKLTLDGAPPSLIAVAMANGETGVVQPVAKLCEIARKAHAITLVDVAQAVGRVPYAAFAIGADYMTVSAHKMNGPKGVGCLVIGPDADVPLLATGGGQEGGRRSGTENVSGIAGFGAACRHRLASLDIDLARMATLRDRLEGLLIGELPEAWVNSRDAKRVVTTTSLTIPDVDGMALVARLDAAGVLCSQVSACSTGRPEPSATLLAMGLSEADAFSTIRLSVGVQTTSDEVERAAKMIADEARFLRAVMGGVA